ncbi:hypothetical protein N7530_010493 [Penicillium desertorum]|uniref:Zn(2)-C6 fungal-type domain-containing protein n=1 Tax=Penicillium desertorum TaxID=1303715 RepID=A0A9W9WI39_9EURO|nr:hypothetical protein N7530_010493 [Penicillium desertorum]
MQAQMRRTRRTANACIACRHSKIKCSGDEPCNNCQRRGIRCEFTEGVNRVVVSERSVCCGIVHEILCSDTSHGCRYLRRLEAQAREQQEYGTTQRHPNTLHRANTAEITGYASESAVQFSGHAGISSIGPSPVPTTSDAPSVWTSPFTLPSTTIKNTKGNKRTWIWLAPSSMWSFTTRLTILMTEKLHSKYPEGAPSLLEREVYPLRWESCASNERLDISGLPSLDYALYLFDTVKFHLGQSYRFFDEELFIKNIQEFYHGDPVKMASEHRLWFVQYLLVLSFGTAFLSRTKSDDPPGSKFFVRAMSLMPNHASLWKDSLLAIEVLAMAGLYLYSIDQRESAFIYVSQPVSL